MNKFVRQVAHVCVVDAVTGAIYNRVNVSDQRGSEYEHRLTATHSVAAKLQQGWVERYPDCADKALVLVER